ncbi:MAG: LysE family translocator [Geminicoccaceae bacterium]|nr:LysE family translocator [Geminicoccaceae bacterium]
MPSTDILLSFLIATGIFAYMPGPALLYVAAQTMARGRIAGWRAVLGVHLGGYVHVMAAVLGLAMLFEAVPVLYAIFKFGGAAYLVWLGIGMFRTRQATGEVDLRLHETNPGRAFWESVTVEILNPKTAIFYVAFLPQFTDPAASFPIWLQLFVLGTIVNVMFSSADVLGVWLADRVTTVLRGSETAGRVARRIGGSILVALGLNVAFSRK